MSLLTAAALVAALLGGVPGAAAAAPNPVKVSPARVSATLAWPHPAGQRVAKTVSYTNRTGRAITLRLSVSAKRSGKSVRTHPFTLSRTSIKVPTRAKRSVTLTIRGHGVPAGTYSGALTATSPDRRVTARTTLTAAIKAKPKPVPPIGPGGPLLTVKALDRTGKPARATLEMDRLDSPEPDGFPYWSSTDQPMRIPAGEYNVRAEITSPDGSRTLANAVIEHTKAGEFVLDSRQARQVQISVQAKDAKPVDSRIHMSFDHGPDRGTSIPPGGRLFVLPVRSPRLRYYFTSLWARSGDVTASPYLYALADQRQGSTPDNFDYRTRDDQLAKVVTTYRAPGATTQPATLRALVAGHGVVHTTIQRPATITWYRSPGHQWSTTLTDRETVNTGTRTWNQGTFTETWGGATLGPSLRDPRFTPTERPAGTRNNNRLAFNTRQSFADSDPHHTNTALGGITPTSTLQADGRTIATGGSALETGLWPEPKTYTLTTSISRPARISTRIDLAWTFRSEHTDTSQPLPLHVIHYLPQLDGANTATPGSQTPIPLWVEHNPGTPTTDLTHLTIETSTDEGTTWHPAQVTKTTTGWTTTITNPTTPGFISLRATTTDTNDNHLTQTIHHAYEIAP